MRNSDDLGMRTSAHSRTMARIRRETPPPAAHGHVGGDDLGPLEDGRTTRDERTTAGDPQHGDLPPDRTGASPASSLAMSLARASHAKQTWRLAPRTVDAAPTAAPQIGMHFLRDLCPRATRRPRPRDRRRRAVQRGRRRRRPAQAASTNAWAASPDRNRVVSARRRRPVRRDISAQPEFASDSDVTLDSPGRDNRPKRPPTAFITAVGHKHTSTLAIRVVTIGGFGRPAAATRDILPGEH